MPREPGKPSRKLPERGDALNIDLPFDVAIKAALDTKPPNAEPPKRGKRPAAKKKPPQKP